MDFQVLSSTLSVFKNFQGPQSFYSKFKHFRGYLKHAMNPDLGSPGQRAVKCVCVLILHKYHQHDTTILQCNFQNQLYKFLEDIIYRAKLSVSNTTTGFI